MQTGQVIKTQNSFYYVQAGSAESLVACKLRGRFRLAEGFKSTDEAMRALRGRAPGDPYPPPEDSE